MSIFGALKSCKNGVCLHTISRLCVFQAVLLLAQHYTMHLTTVITAPKHQCRKRTQFLAADMSGFGALKSSKNGVCLHTISRLCVFQAVLLLAQHYTMHLTTVITAPKHQCRKRKQFLAADMSIFGALKSCKNGVCLHTISRLCVFQAVLLLANHYTMHLTTVITAPKHQCRKRTHFQAADMSIFGAVKSCKNGVYLHIISRLCVFQAVLLLAQHYTMHLTTVITAPKHQCRK
jgi:NADH:ubiquinone oxidoreductase subunit 3 (subunit A)